MTVVVRQPDNSRRFCGARLKSGLGRCRQAPLRGKMRCRVHGGKLTGGMRHKDPAAYIQFWRSRYKRWLLLRQRLGLPHPGGRPRKLSRVKKMVDAADKQLGQALDAIDAVLPAEVEGEEETAPVLLARTARDGIQQLRRIINMPVNACLGDNGLPATPHDQKTLRLIGDMALGVQKIFVRAAEAEFRVRQSDSLQRLFEEIAAEKGLTKLQPDQ